MVGASFPSWERGLKPLLFLPLPSSSASFPSWERGLKLLTIYGPATNPQVVPLVGTWIETYGSLSFFFTSLSFPSWERGLKRLPLLQLPGPAESFPLWERGLKPSPVILVFDRRPPSFPLWERGLKRLYGYSEDDTILVVPLAETCIET